MPRQLLLKRVDELEVCELPDKTLFVYDQQQRVTHHLSPETALIWEKCDGNNELSDLEQIVRLEFSHVKARSAVRNAINTLSQFKLLKW